MKHISFITTAAHKYRALSQHVHMPGYQFEQLSIETPEIQAHTASEVALFSARYMAQQLPHPVICEDVTHHITSLGGFPGVTLKYVETQIGTEGILKLLEGKDRRSYFDLAVAYADPMGNTAVFHATQHGHVAIAPAGGGFVMDSIFIPTGETETISQLLQKRAFHRPHDHYDRLVAYLESI